MPCNFLITLHGGIYDYSGNMICSGTIAQSMIWSLLWWALGNNFPQACMWLFDK